MEWILGVLILILGGAAIVVIYLSERINVFESLLGLNPKVTTEKIADHMAFGPNPFGDLSGESLWNAMRGEPLDEEYDIDTLRLRYELVISRHIETLVEDGRFDARIGDRTTPKSILRISMLRGSVESFLPFAEASRLYEIGHEFENDNSKAATLISEIDDIVDDLYEKIELTRQHSFGTGLLPLPDSELDGNDSSDPPSIEDETQTIQAETENLLLEVDPGEEVQDKN